MTLTTQQQRKIFSEEAIIIRKKAAVNLIIYRPATDDGQLDLAKRVSDVHAAIVIQRLRSLNCPAGQKVQLLNTIIDTVEARTSQNAKKSSTSGKNTPK